MGQPPRPRRRGHRRAHHGRGSPEPAARTVDYRHLKSAFPLARGYSDEQVAEIHAAALTVLEELGVQVKHDGARRLLARTGAPVSGHQVRFGRELVEAAIATSPPEFTLTGAAGTLDIGGRNTQFIPVGGPPYAMDTARGKRAGTLEDFRNFVRLAHSFDVIHMTGPSVEPQDIDPRLRHLEMMRVQMLDSDKPTFIYARGAAQVADAFELLRLRYGVDEAGFRARPHACTVINTNSPLILDVPMCQGLIDFAAAGQVCIITPFTLSGATAPVTIPGALVQQHAELLAGLVLTQTVRPGAPVVYGGFTSNVDMKSGAPAFGTPEYVRACWGTGQLGRPALAVVGLVRFQRPGRPGDPGDSDVPLGRAHRRGQHRHPRRGLARGRPQRLVRDVHPRRGAAPARGGADAAGALECGRACPRGVARGRLRRALLRRRPHDGTLPDGVLHPRGSRTGRISAGGRKPAAGPRRNGRTTSGSRGWKTSGRRTSIRAWSRASTPSLPGGRKKAARIR